MSKASTFLALMTTAATLSAQTNDFALAKKLPASRRDLVLSGRKHETAARPNLTIVTTNHVLISGMLVSQSSSNLVVSSSGLEISIPLGQIKWCETNLVSATVSHASGEVVPAAPTNSSADILAEFNKPHSEAEMRGLLQTQEGQALVKSIAAAYIGAGTDAETSAARESYLNAVQQFESGSIGITEIQGQARGLLGQLGPYDKELNNDPNAEEWKEYREILQGFTSEAPAATSEQPR
jgi:hypothetical protein